MFKPLLTCLLVQAILISCATQNGARSQAWENKLDPSLREVLETEPAQTQSAQGLSVLLKCAAPLSAEQKRQLANLGVRLQAEAGAIITATLPAQAVTQVAKLDYVIYLELSKERKISSPGN
ncbi:MAG: hypothetical protein AAB354_10795 [candidate division KSB1 bacterium]